MSRIAPEFWTALSSSARPGSEYPVRPPVAEISPRLLGSLSPVGERCFVIPLAPSDDAAEDSRSRGLRVTTIEMENDQGARGRYTIVTCLDATSHDLFDVVGVDLAIAMATLAPAAAINRVMAKWRRFWAQLPRHLLSREQQIGLIGELWFLSRWVIPAAGASTAANRWRGQARSRHDFEWRGRSVEVKATASVSKFTCRVNGIEQLEPPENGELLLFGLRVREEAGASLTLPQLVEECRAAISADHDALAVFETALLQADYSPTFASDYAQSRWRVVDERLYRVDENFSRLRPAHFSSGLPPGVIDISYTLDLSAARGEYISSPSAAQQLLR